LQVGGYLIAKAAQDDIGKSLIGVFLPILEVVNKKKVSGY